MKHPLTVKYSKGYLQNAMKMETYREALYRKFTETNDKKYLERFKSIDKICNYLWTIQTEETYVDSKQTMPSPQE